MIRPQSLGLNRAIRAQDDHRNRHSLVTMVALFFMLCSIYLLTHNAGLVVNDELEMIDMVGSMVDFSDAKYDLALWYRWPGGLRSDMDANSLYPLPTSPIEPVYSYISTPLYRLATAVPGLGVVHMIWVVNSIITAAACVLMFKYARLLGYRSKVALTAALALGTCTILWPYTQTFMREPLAVFLLLLTGYFLEKSRGGKWRWGYISAGVLVFGVTFLSKEPVLLALPGLLILLIPERTPFVRGPWVHPGLRIAMGIALYIPLLLIYSDILPTLFAEPVHLYQQYSLSADYAKNALHTYLLSPGGSLWGTSPILILAFPGAWMLWRGRQPRYVWATVLMVLGFAIGHALMSGPHWFGGPLWPPRFMIPVIPFVAICALPAIEYVLNKPLKSVIGLAMGILVLYSLWWQFNGVALDWNDFANSLPPESFHLGEWGKGINYLRYMRPVILTPLWFDNHLNFTWLRTDVYLWPIVFGGFAILWGVVLRKSHAFAQRRGITAIVILASSMAFITPVLLTQFYERDATFLGNNAALHDISAILDSEEKLGDVLIVNDTMYQPFFLNDARFDDVRVVVFPTPPGERGSFEQVPQMISDDVTELLKPGAPALIDALARQRDRLWVLMETGPFIPWSIRPLEHFMVQYYYPIRELQADPPDPNVRLLEFATVRAPDGSQPPEYTTTVNFGESIILGGFTLPVGEVYAPGDALPVTLYWQTGAPLAEDYSVALFLAATDDVPVVQGMDSGPNGGFQPTTTWMTEQIIQDNRAMRLPEDTPPGDYRLWVRLYTWGEDGIDHLTVTGGATFEDSIAVLPVTITVEDRAD